MYRLFVEALLINCKIILIVNFWAGIAHISSVVVHPLDAHIFEVDKIMIFNQFHIAIPYSLF